MDDNFNIQLRKIEDFMKSREKCIQIIERENNCEKNKFCKLLWPTFFSNIKLSINFILCSLAHIIPYSSPKIFIYRLMGMKIGKEAFISPWVRIDPSFPELITIGNYSIIGVGAKIWSHDTTNKILRIGRVNIGKNVIIGGFSMIRSGIEIGDDAIVGIGAVVFDDVPAKTTVIGNPAKPTKVFFEN